MARIFEPIFEALDRSGVRYVVVGGVAVVLHGHARLTVDVDLVVDLSPDSASGAIAALSAIGFVPVMPVRAEDFADPVQRRRWADEEGMQVFSMFDPDDPLRRVDLFADYPVPFEQLWARSTTIQLAESAVHIASIEDLIAMKQAAGRPQDLADIEALELIRDSLGGADE